ncbi:hypothetical protein D1007_57718 [Hordeum vulgare]|nr:hypothetical protein D1007_57718 [Hordeum vulgare]
MSSSASFHAGGGGDHGGTGEVPTHPKPPREGAIVTSGARRTHNLGQRQEEEENSNWDARRAGGSLTGPAEAHLGGEVIMDDVAFVAVDFEEEEEEVEETERWKLLGQPRARRRMSFSFGSAGSANNIDQLRSSGSSKPEEEDGIPQRVDAHDNFEQGEIPCSDAADQKLAKEVNNIKLHLVSEEPECSKMQNLKACFTAKAPVNSGVDGSKQRKKKSAMPKKGTGGGRSGNLVIRDEPLGSDEMIPALRSLSSISSFGTASLSLDLHDSVLGKRQMDGMLGFKLVADATNAMVPYVAVEPGGIQKKGKVDKLAEAQGCLMSKILAISEIRTSTNRLVQDVLAWAPDPKGVKYARLTTSHMRRNFGHLGRRQVEHQMFPRGDLVKGKMVPSHQGKLTANQKEEVQPKDRVQRWTKPPPGWTKLNIDGDYSEGNKTGGAGMILRDEEGQVIFSSCRYLRTCSSALEAELMACLEGISIARVWSELPMIVELDCSCAVQMIVEEGIDRSPHATLVMQLKQALGEIGEHVISHVVRSRNALADALARLGRINHRTAVWLRGIPEEVDTLCKEDSVG